MIETSNGVFQPATLLAGTFLATHGGSFSVGEELVSQLRENGWYVILTSTKPGRLARLLDTLETIWRRRREFDVAAVDVYSGRGFRLAEATCRALRAIGRPYLLVLRGGNLPSFARRHPRRVASLLQSASAVVAPSQYLIRHLEAFCPTIRLLPNPLTISAYPFRMRRVLRPRLIWLRAFHEIYNPHLIPRVVAELVPSYPTLQITMVGPDKGDGSKQSTQELARRLGVGDRIRFQGPITKAMVGDWLSQNDILLNSTSVDNSPVSVLEAMACGLCVVSTDAGGLPYLIRDGENGLLVPVNRPELMAAAVRRVLVDAGLAQRLSSTARSDAEQCDWPVVLPQWERLLRETSACETLLGQHAS